MKSQFKPIAIIPHYNHSDTISAVVDKLRKLNLPVLIVDDGSKDEHKMVLSILATQEDISVIYREQNGGKGAAVKTGLLEAFKQDFTHALQVDADGQHRIEDAELMLTKSEQSSTSLICANPIYSDDAPKARLYGRKITNFWIAINTLSLDIPDGMCGFRIYPLQQIMPIVEKEKIGDYMDFDTEILVKIHWRYIPMIWIDTPVKYELGGVSHFRGWKDNWLISKMHARLFFGMLFRLLSGKKV
ncbi:glycosyltransferase family 2 protein [Otariodibacter oris]|uniref:Glycosyltransferase involved in cell wall biosynthesis n=1 Tax=Otariodibacter oris TaxID=1032623 RepID=A0A420XG68_9PAST|nr:glycosyltransferase family 2 protein [Otariodibacter oris]QGM79966.1 glycosyl transferase [Otariodibacter oris]RKR71788.1 glycosyltransferase involved in cell wall biosynthesis [Otariodibacter oris]